MSKQPTKAERQHMNRVAALGCWVCRCQGNEGTPAALHHIKAGITGVGLKASHWRILPLCGIHHQYGDGTETHGGQWGYHISPETFESLYGDQEDILRDVLRELGLNPADAKFRPALLGESLAA